VWHPPQTLTCRLFVQRSIETLSRPVPDGKIQRICVDACSKSRSSLSKYHVFPHTPVPLSRKTLLSRSSTLVRHEHFRRVVKILFSRSLFERGFCVIDFSQLSKKKENQLMYFEEIFRNLIKRMCPVAPPCLQLFES